MNLIEKIKEKRLVVKEARDDREIVVAVPDIKEYLVKEYERANSLKLINEGLEEQIKNARETEIKYNATLVTLNEYSSRLERAERDITRWKNNYNQAQQDVKSAIDEVNSYKIKLNETAITKSEITQEIVNEVKADIILKINNHKGNLSKKIVCDIIGSYEKEG
jgi:hypothetical protein